MEDVFIHPSSDVSPEAQIGQGTKIWQHCTVLKGAVIGEHCLLSQNVFVEGRTRLGNNVKVKNNVSIYECVELDDDVFVGPSAVFTNVLTPRSHWPRKGQFLATRVGRGVTIGANAVIVCGVSIGRYAMIGAGAVVTRDVAEFALVYGNPAHRRGWVCFCGEIIGPLEEGARHDCPVCGSSYFLQHNQLLPIQLAQA